MKALSFFLSLMFVTPVYGKTVILKSESGNSKDYQAYVLSSPSHQFPVDYLLQNFPSPAARQTLIDLFSRAQASYANGSLIEAATDFKKVVALVEMDQWSEEEQTTFLYSFLRLAQLSQSSIEAEEWIKKAIVWAPVGKLSEAYFPPPLAEKFKVMKAEHQTVKARLHNFSDSFEVVMINSRIIDLMKEREISLPQGPVRLTLLSNTFQTSTVVTEAGEIEQLRPERKPWVTGSCNKPTMYWSEPQLAKPYFRTNCGELRPDVKVADLEYKREPISSPIQPSMPVASSSARIPFYERTWFWIGVGAITAAVVVAQVNSSNSKTRPSSHDGF